MHEQPTHHVERVMHCNANDLDYYIALTYASNARLIYCFTLLVLSRSAVSAIEGCIMQVPITCCLDLDTHPPQAALSPGRTFPRGLRLEVGTPSSLPHLSEIITHSRFQAINPLSRTALTESAVEIAVPPFAQQVPDVFGQSSVITDGAMALRRGVATYAEPRTYNYTLLRGFSAPASAISRSFPCHIHGGFPCHRLESAYQQPTPPSRPTPVGVSSATTSVTE